MTKEEFLGFARRCCNNAELGGEQSMSRAVDARAFDARFAALLEEHAAVCRRIATYLKSRGEY